MGMKWLGYAASIAIVGFLVSHAKAEENLRSGNYMLSHCKNLLAGANPGVWEGQCGGSIYALMYVGSSLKDDFRFCKPDGVTQEQAERIVVKYLSDHPDILHKSFLGLAAAALRQAWPCPK